MRTAHFWKRWGPSLTLMAIIFVFSSIPSDTMPSFGAYDLSFKKGGHMLGYALLALAYERGLGHRRWRSMGLAWLLTVIYAASDEVHQFFVPGRSCALVDVGIDALGAFLGLLFYRWRQR